MTALRKILFLPVAMAALFSCKKDGQIKPVTIPSDSLAIELLAQNLTLPWGLACLPDGSLLFTERNGKVNLLSKGATAHITLSQRSVNTVSEGGALSIAVDPDFNANHCIYLYETTIAGINHVIRLKLNGTALIEDGIIVDSIPYGVNHDGGALKFGPDHYLYIGTGDGLQPMNAQDKNSLAGKILRVDRNGHAAPGNPFNSRIWTYGHRNVQGFTWTSNGQMLATEHGPSGENGWCCHDEINYIQSGNNYGWPLAYGGAETGSLTPALINSGNDTWAPSGCTYLDNNAIWPNTFVVAGLKGERLLRFEFYALANTLVPLPDTLQGTFQRLRNVVEAPDGSIVFCTSNINSVPTPGADDDKVLRLFRK